LNDVHDVPLHDIAHMGETAAAIAALPGRKIVFTNGARAYAERILARLGLETVIDGLSAIEDRDLAAKPQDAAFAALLGRFGIAPRAAVLFDDHLVNLETAARLGFKTVLVGAVDAPAFVDLAAPTLADALAFVRRG
jgi:putative hydrolase of the HAD superfamily